VREYYSFSKPNVALTSDIVIAAGPMLKIPVVAI
jgi:hypothetical protein